MVAYFCFVAVGRYIFGTFCKWILVLIIGNYTSFALLIDGFSPDHQLVVIKKRMVYVQAGADVVQPGRYPVGDAVLHFHLLSGASFPCFIDYAMVYLLGVET